jgi:hypothetical protein
MSEKKIRETEVGSRLQRLADSWGEINLYYVYDELGEIADIVWGMIETSEDE